MIRTTRNESGRAAAETQAHEAGSPTSTEVTRRPRVRGGLWERATRLPRAHERDFAEGRHAPADAEPHLLRVIDDPPQAQIKTTVEKGSTVYTDSHRSYDGGRFVKVLHRTEDKRLTYKALIAKAFRPRVLHGAVLPSIPPNRASSCRLPTLERQRSRITCARTAGWVRRATRLRAWALASP
jgi:hypothetical protein